MMEHYIIIRVTEDGDTSNPMRRIGAGFLRTLIHRVAKDNNITIADNIIREDRLFYPNQREVPYEEARELFRKVM